MPYKIHYVYDTGNTFETERGCTGALDYEWKQLEHAKVALKRMKQHYLWIESLDTTYAEDLPKPTWLKSKPSAPYRSKWSFNTIGNDGKEIWIYAGEYLGYFETLRSANIVSTGDDDMSFNLED